MASNANDVGPTHPAVFTTRTPYRLPSQKFMIPLGWKRYQLSQLINKALSLPQPIPFDFLVQGEILRSSLGEWCAEKGIGEVSYTSLVSSGDGSAQMLCRRVRCKSNTSNQFYHLKRCRLFHTKTGCHQYPVKYQGNYLTHSHSLFTRPNVT